MKFVDALEQALQEFDVTISKGGPTTYMVWLAVEGGPKDAYIRAGGETLSHALHNALTYKPDEPEPEDSTGVRICHIGLSAMQWGRLNKALNRVYRYTEGTMSLRQYLLQGSWVEKNKRTRTHSRKRIHLEYKRLKAPKIEYTIWHKDDFGMDIPKIVYDAIDLPERE